MSSASIKPRHLSLESKLGSYGLPSPSLSPDCSIDSMETMTRDGHSPSSTSTLPERRITRAAKAHARNRFLPRIDTEQLKSLSIREKHAVNHVARSSEADVRQQQFQKYCEILWKTGRANLGNKKAPHVNIAPVRLPTTPVASYESSITIYTVVHSQGHSPVGLRRKFDRSLLNATVPEPSRSPSTPNFDRDELLSAIVDTNKALTTRRLRNGTKTVSSRRDTRLRRDMVPDGIPMRMLIPVQPPKLSNTSLLIQNCTQTFHMRDPICQF